MVSVWPWVLLILGVLSRVFIPWLAKRRENPAEAKWDWKFVWPQLVAAVLILLLLPVLVTDLEAVGTLPLQVGWLAGWAAADIGRKTYKALATEEG